MTERNSERPRKAAVGIRRLKNEASRLVDEVRERGVEYVVTKRGEPVAVIRPWTAQDVAEEQRRRAREVVKALTALANRVSEAADPRSAAEAVADQRR